MAFPTHTSTTTSTVETATTSHSVDLGTTADGDHLFMVFSFHCVSPGAFTVATPAGWDLIGTVYRTDFNGRVGFFHRHADGTEGATETVTTSGNSKSASQVLRVTGGYDGGEGVGWAHSALVGDFDSTPDPAAVTAPWGSAQNLFGVMLGYGASNDPINSYPANYTTLQTETQNSSAGQPCTAGSASRQLAAASDNPGAFTLGGGENSGCVTIVVRPASGVVAQPVRAEANPVARVPSIRNEIIVTPVRAVANPAARLAEVVRAPRPLFPAATLDVTVEAAFGAGDSNPMEWTWFDLSGRLLAGESAMTINRGRPDEKSQPSPASVATVLDNGDGALTPNQPTSPYWPNIRRNTPLRVSAPSRTPALDLPGIDGAYASTPNHPDFAITGTVDVRVRVEPDQWSTGRRWNNASPMVHTYPQPFVGRWGADGELGWVFDIGSYGIPSFSWAPDGTTGTLVFAPVTDVAVAALGPIWLACTFSPSLAGQIVADIYTHADTDSPPADLDEWIYLGSQSYGSTSSLYTAGSAPLTIGGPYQHSTQSPDHDTFRGRFLAMQLRDGRNGTLVAAPDFTAAAVGDAAFVDSVGKTWTIHGAADISLRRTRLVAGVDEWDPTWPFGDNEPLNPSGVRPSESRVRVVASGILRRLSQGTKALRSPLRRHVTGDQYTGQVVAYWPLEDDGGAVNYGSAVAGERPLAAAGLDAGSDTTLPASGGLPTIRGGEVGYWYAVVPTAADGTAWAINWLFRIPTPEAGAAETPHMTVLTGGSAARWEFSTSESAAVLRVYAPDGTQLVSNATGIGTEVYDGWVLAQLEARQDGANIDWAWYLNLIDLGDAFGGSNTFTGTLGAVTALTNTVTAPPDGMSIGHFIVSTGLPNGWLAGADTAWVGESAAHRIFRLCNEEGIPVEIIGDPAIESHSFRGDLTVSEPMGPQRQLTFIDLLQQCVELDLGVLSERRNAPGFVYRCRHTLENQTPAMALDAARDGIGDIVNPFDPTLDDQRVRNDVEVASTSGSSARVVDEASIRAEGRYDTSIEVAGVGGVDIQLAILNTQAGLIAAVADQNLLQAGWRLHLGTSEDMRYPTVEVDLAIALSQIDSWLDTRLGDRVTVDNLPVQHPALTVELVVEAISESLRHNGWDVALTCSPGGPWLVGVLDE